MASRSGEEEWEFDLRNAKGLLEWTITGGTLIEGRMRKMISKVLDGKAKGIKETNNDQ